MKKTLPPCDLHLHSYYSDGNLSPGELVRRGLQAGLSAISTTDYDIIAGQAEALESGMAQGLEVVTGVEFSVSLANTDVHILGYLFDHLDPGLGERLDILSRSRRDRAEEIVKRLKRLGLGIELDEVTAMAGRGTVGRLHVARVLLEKGYITNIQQAFWSYIGDGCPAFVDKESLELDEVVELINNAGGIAVWAHPGANIRDQALVKKILAAGIEGLEVWHPNHNADITRRLRALAEKTGLVCTGGSDYHFTEAMKADIGGRSAPYSDLVKARERAAGHLA